jgi:hypothetical protein
MSFLRNNEQGLNQPDDAKDKSPPPFLPFQALVPSDVHCLVRSNHQIAENPLSTVLFSKPRQQLSVVFLQETGYCSSQVDSLQENYSQSLSTHSLYSSIRLSPPKPSNPISMVDPKGLPHEIYTASVGSKHNVQSQNHP